MKKLNIFLAVLFSLFAIVQYNDPDPLYWILIYAYVAMMCVFPIFKKHYPALIGLGLGVCLWGFYTLLPDFIAWIKMGTPNIASEMKTEEPHIELVREFLGYILCISVLVFQFFQGRKMTKGE